MIRFRRPHFFKSTLGLVITGAILLVIAGGGYALFLGGGNGPAAGNGPINLSKGLVGWWKMDGNVADATPYNTVCTPQFFTPGYTSDREGKPNAAFTIGSAKLGFTCGQPAALQVSNVTVAAWVNPSSYDSSGSGIESYGGIVQFYFDSSGFLRFQVHDPSNVSHTFISPTTYAAGNWYHVAATYDGSNVVLYVNGTAVLTTSYAGGIGTNHYSDAGNDFLLSNYGSDSTTRGFLGSLDDIRYYSRALSANEMTALYNTYNDPLDIAQGENGLVGWWKLNGNLNDSTPYATVCTPQFFTPSYAVDRHGVTNQALDLSGGSTLGADCGTPSVLKDSNTTISAWVKPTGWGSNISDIAGWGTTMIFFFTSNGHLEFQTHDTSNIPHSFTSASAYALNQWYHVAVTYDGTSLVLYVNGSAISTTAYASGIGTSYEGSGNDFGLGGDGSSTDGFIGSLADIRVYNRALTSTEIQQQYNSYNSQISLGGDGGTGSNSVNLQKGLMGYWPMNGNPKDSTPYSNDGTVSGAALAVDRKGRANSAYSFNGSTNYIDLPVTPTYGALTVSLWFNAGSITGDNPRILSNSHTATDQHGFELMFNNGGASGYFAVGTGTQAQANWSQQLVTGQWYHYVGVYDGTNVYVYINGVLVGSTPFAGGTISASGYDVNIGRDPAYNGDYFNGSVDDVRIYDRALNAAEVQALYNEYQ